MRIIAGAFKGRSLIAPAGSGTRPTSDRARQALFDMILHAPWGGRELIAGATVLDAFAGTGALGLEALSRGAGFAHFIEREPAALAALRANIAGCKVVAARVWAGDALAPPAGVACRLVFLDPPYRKGLIAGSLGRLRVAGWIAAGTVVVAEMGQDEASPAGEQLLAERAFGAARVEVWRE